MSLKHPLYEAESLDWEKYRLTWEGGREFINKYLVQFSNREDSADFLTRKRVTYCPAHAKSAVTEIKNSIFERMVDIVRSDGPKSYLASVTGSNGGVDLTGTTMNNFIGTKVLPELLTIRKVGVYIDKESVSFNTRAEELAANEHPYLYMYTAEEILSWNHDKRGELTAVLLLDTEDTLDPETGLPDGTKEVFKLVKKENDTTVSVTRYSKSPEDGTVTLLKLKHIPFVIFELSDSLLKDTADYQIALLNLASSDMGYCMKSNFPFYTEQRNGLTDLATKTFREVVDPETGARTLIQVNPAEVNIGSASGRTYGKDLDRPGFINPSPEPLQVSMEKQEKMKQEIRQLVQLALTNLAPTRQSADSKDKDQQGLEAGLACIGLELEKGERKIGAIWAEYEGEDEPYVSYPTNFSLRSDEDRRAEAKELTEQIPKIPSATYQREVAKQVITLTLGKKVNSEKLAKMHAEIDAAEVIVIDPEIIKADHEAGFVSTELASEARGYPKGEVEQAKKDHAERLARISMAQMAGGAASGTDAASARGMDDMSADEGESAKIEKEESQSSDVSDDGSRSVRGEAK